MGTEPKAKAKIERGPTAQRVAANVKEAREKLRLSLEALSQRMSELGRPMLRSGLAKIESGERRVDVDDLMALAIALQVTPNRLLLGSPLEETDFGVIFLAPRYAYRDKDAWTWACGEGAIPGVESWTTAGAVIDWIRENRPHRPPVLLAPDEWRKMKPFEERFAALREDMEAAGFDMRALYDDVVFEASATGQELSGDFDHGGDS